MRRQGLALYKPSATTKRDFDSGDELNDYQDDYESELEAFIELILKEKNDDDNV